MTETARENPGNLTCLQWHHLHTGAHRLFEAIWAEMEAITASREPGLPVPPDWSHLHDLLTLASVISAITGRHASQAALLPASTAGEEP